MNSARSPVSSGGATACCPRMTSPVVPFSDTQSPSRSFTPPTDMVPASSSIASAPHPQMHVLPHPLATTATCDVMPPRAVSTPSAASMPPTSPGDVSTRTRMALPPEALSALASSALKTICPTAAPGEAGRPCRRSMQSARSSTLN